MKHLQATEKNEIGKKIEKKAKQNGLKKDKK